MNNMNLKVDDYQGYNIQVSGKSYTPQVDTMNSKSF